MTTTKMVISYVSGLQHRSPTAARIPLPRQKAIAMLGTTVVFLRELVTTSSTNSKLQVRIASMHNPCDAVTPGVNVNVGTVTFPPVGFKLHRSHRSVKSNKRRLCQTPLHGHRLRTCCATPTTDKTLPRPNILTCRDVGFWHCVWQICCTTSCRIIVENLSVGGVVQHVRSRCPRSGVWHFIRGL